MPHSRKRASDLRCHAVKRAAQRNGVFLSLEQVLDIERCIRTGQAEFLHRQSNVRTVFRVDGLVVVYDKKRGCIVTVLTERMVQPCGKVNS